MAIKVLCDLIKDRCQENFIDDKNMRVVRKVAKLTVNQKVEILNKLKNGESIKKICVDYSVSRSTVCRMKKNEAAIRKFAKNSENSTWRRFSLKTAEYPKMEKLLFKWFSKQRANKVPVSVAAIKSKALFFHNKLTNKPFNASLGWLRKFKERHGIRMFKICGEKLSNEMENVDAFLQEFTTNINELGLVPDQIYNCNESGLFFKLLPNTTLASLSEKSTSKERITFLPCVNATGTHKLKLFVVGKSENPRELKNFYNWPVHYRQNKSGWMTYVIFKNWFKNVFVPEVTQFLCCKNLPKKALLLIDNAPCHPKNNELKSDDGNFVIMCLPPNCTSLLQPLNQNAINLTKFCYKQNLLTHLIGTKGTTGLEKNINDFNIHMAVTLLANAWEKVSAVAIKKFWNCLMSKTALRTNEDNLPLSLLRDQVAQEPASMSLSISNLLQDILPEIRFTDGEIIEWLKEDYSDECEEDIDFSDEEISENIQI